MVKLPKTDAEYIEFLEGALDIFNKYNGVRGKKDWRLLIEKNPKLFRNFRNLITSLIENIAYISNKKIWFTTAIDTIPQKEKRIRLKIQLNLLLDNFNDMINLQKQLAK